MKLGIDRGLVRAAAAVALLAGAAGTAHGDVRAGVVRKVLADPMDERYSWLVLAGADGDVSVAIPCSNVPPAQVKALVDREVEISGTSIDAIGWMNGQKPRFSAETAADIRVLATNRAAFASLHRHGETGAVLAVSRDAFYIRQPKNKCLRVRPADGEAMPRVGATVAVTAFPETDAFYTMFDEALVRTLDVAPTNFPVQALRPGQIFNGAPGTRSLHWPLHGRIVTVTGRLFRTSDESPALRACWLDDGETTFFIDDSGLAASPLADIETGSVLRLTGLLFAEFSQRPLPGHLPEFRHFALIPRSADDIAVAKRPPWWTPARMLACVALLALGFGAVFLRYRILLAHSRIKTEERTRLAVELHDSLSQTLTGVAIQLDTASRGVPADAPSGRLLLSARQILASCRKELQNCLWDLRSSAFSERTVGEALARAVEPVVGAAALKIRFGLDCREISESVLHALIKVARELVANAVNHGRATRVAIAGERRGGRIRFSVTDDGAGFDPARAAGPREGHFGLQGVRERLAAYDGAIAFSRLARGGMKARVEINLQKGE